MKQNNLVNLQYIIRNVSAFSLSLILLGSCAPLPANSHYCRQEETFVCFTPPQGCVKYLISLINAAKNNILVQAYSFTSKNITDSLIQAHRRGVKVSVLIDRTSITSRGSEIPALKDAGISVSVCKVPGIAHNKVLIIDEQIIVTGSYNFTNAAETRNAENLLILNNKDLAKKYITNWFNLQARE